MHSRRHPEDYTKLSPLRRREERRAPSRIGTAVDRDRQVVYQREAVHSSLRYVRNSSPFARTASPERSDHYGKSGNLRGERRQPGSVSHEEIRERPKTDVDLRIPDGEFCESSRVSHADGGSRLKHVHIYGHAAYGAINNNRDFNAFSGRVTPLRGKSKAIEDGEIVEPYCEVCANGQSPSSGMDISHNEDGRHRSHGHLTRSPMTESYKDRDATLYAREGSLAAHHRTAHASEVSSSNNNGTRSPLGNKLKRKIRDSYGDDEIPPPSDELIYGMRSSRLVDISAYPKGLPLDAGQNHGKPQDLLLNHSHFQHRGHRTHEDDHEELHHKKQQKIVRENRVHRGYGYPSKNLHDMESPHDRLPYNCAEINDHIGDSSTPCRGHTTDGSIAVIDDYGNPGHGTTWRHTSLRTPTLPNCCRESGAPERCGEFLESTYVHPDYENRPPRTRKATKFGSTNDYIARPSQDYSFRIDDDIPETYRREELSYYGRKGRGIAVKLEREEDEGMYLPSKPIDIDSPETHHREELSNYGRKGRGIAVKLQRVEDEGIYLPSKLIDIDSPETYHREEMSNYGRKARGISVRLQTVEDDGMYFPSKTIDADSPETHHREEMSSYGRNGRGIAVRLQRVAEDGLHLPSKLIDADSPRTRHREMTNYGRKGRGIAARLQRMEEDSIYLPSEPVDADSPETFHREEMSNYGRKGRGIATRLQRVEEDGRYLPSKPMLNTMYGVEENFLGGNCNDMMARKRNTIDYQDLNDSEGLIAEEDMNDSYGYGSRSNETGIGEVAHHRLVHQRGIASGERLSIKKRLEYLPDHPARFGVYRGAGMNIHPKSGPIKGYKPNYHMNKKNGFYKNPKFGKSNDDYFEDSGAAQEYDLPEDQEIPEEPALQEDSDEFKQLVNEAFLNYSKSININSAVQRRYREQGKAGSLFCIVCSRRFSKEFLNTENLVKHAFMARRAQMRANHLGLQRAICVLLGWDTYIPEEMPTVPPRVLPEEEALALKEDLIIWPPVIIIHNISMSTDHPEDQKVIPVESVKAFLRGKGYAEGKMVVCLGKPADQSVMVVKFLGTFSGFGNALKLHQFFAENKRGRVEFQKMITTKGGGGWRSTNIGVSGGEDEAEQILYGYMGIAEDLDSVDFRTKNICKIKSKKEIQDFADDPVKN